MNKQQTAMPVLADILSVLAKNLLQVKLVVGYKDSINGYGWHVRYYVEVYKTVEFCSKCKNNFNVNYKDDYFPKYHQHSHRTNIENIYSNEFMNENDLCNGLLTIVLPTMEK